MFRLIMCLTTFVSLCAARPSSLIAVGMDRGVEATDTGSHLHSSDIFAGEGLSANKLQPMAYEGCSCTCDCQDDEVDCSCICECEDEEDEHRVSLQKKREEEEIRLARASVTGEGLQQLEEQNIANERRELFYRSLQGGSFSLGAAGLSETTLISPAPTSSPTISTAPSSYPTVSPSAAPTQVDEGRRVVEQISGLRAVAEGRLIRRRKQ